MRGPRGPCLIQNSRSQPNSKITPLRGSSLNLQDRENKFMVTKRSGRKRGREREIRIAPDDVTIYETGK